MGFFAKMIMLAVASGLVAGNMDKIEEFYIELTSQAHVVVNGMDMRNIAMKLDHHYLRNGRYPLENEFQEWMRKNFRENEFRELTADTWGSPLDYETWDKGQGFRLTSFGPDKEKGTGDDIVVTGP